MREESSRQPEASSQGLRVNPSRTLSAPSTDCINVGFIWVPERPVGPGNKEHMGLCELINPKPTIDLTPLRPRQITSWPVHLFPFLFYL